MDIVIDVVGYVTPTSPARQLIATAAHAANVTIAAGATTTVSLSAVPGIPTGVNGVAASSHLSCLSGSGYLRVWTADQVEPLGTSVLNYKSDSNRTDFDIVPVGATKSIKLHNVGTGSIVISIDVSGWFCGRELTTPLVTGNNRSAAIRARRA